MLCKLTRFYPAYKIDDLVNLPDRQLGIMWQAITVIEAQEQLKQMSVADWPNMKKNSREKIHKELFQKAYPKDQSKKNFITPQQLQKILGR